MQKDAKKMQKDAQSKSKHVSSDSSFSDQFDDVGLTGCPKSNDPSHMTSNAQHKGQHKGQDNGCLNHRALRTISL